jgi:RNA polymerase sigma-70 factor (ECF subfamily)
MEASEEAEIVSRVLQGDKEAYIILVDAYKKPVFNLAYRLTGSYHEAEDLAQDAFVKAYSKLRHFNDKKSFFTWMYSLSLNIIRNHLKKKKRARFLEIDESSIAADPSPEISMIESQEFELLQRCFNRLPEDVREVIALKYYQGLSFESIAEIYGISLSAAKMRVYRGIEKLRELMKKC